DREGAVKILGAEAAAPAAARRLDEIGAALIARGIEAGADRAALLQFEVAIVRIAAAQVDGVEEARTGIDLGAAVDPRLGDVDARRLRLDGGIQRVADRDAVKAVIMIDREADIVLARDPGGAGSDVPGFRGA